MLAKKNRVLRRVMGMDCFSPEMPVEAYDEIVRIVTQYYPELTAQAVLILHVMDGDMAEEMADAMDETLREVFAAQVEIM